MQRDRLIAIGAVTVEAARIDLGRSFYVVLRQPEASSRENILVHGIGGTAQREGEDPAEALLAFLEFAGKAPLVGFHAGFDDALIRRAMREFLGEPYDRRWIDLAQLAPELMPEEARARTHLDAWLERFGIEVFSRHDAAADALAHRAAPPRAAPPGGRAAGRDRRGDAVGSGRGALAGRPQLNREGTMLGAMATTTPRAEELRAAIRAARDIDEVARAAARVRELPRPMLDEGTAPEAITALVTGVNDLVTTRLIELTGLDAALRDAGACWIVLGSAGRAEQTLATDQDNAIVFADAADPEARRRALLPLAERVNRGTRSLRLSAVPRRGDGGQSALVPGAVGVARAVRGLDRPARAGGAAERGHLLRLPRGPRRAGPRVRAARLARRRMRRTAAGSCSRWSGTRSGTSRRSVSSGTSRSRAAASIRGRST